MTNEGHSETEGEFKPFCSYLLYHNVSIKPHTLGVSSFLMTVRSNIYTRFSRLSII